MRTNRQKTLQLSLLLLILILGIGYAALHTTLKVDGTVNVAKATWDVHFENVQITNGSVTANPAPTSNNTDTTEMTYTINFTKPGDYFEFTTDIVNDGTIDAMVDVVSNNAYASAASTTPIALPTYLTNTVTYDDGSPILQNQKLDHNTSEKIKVRVEFKKDISVSDLPSSGDTTIVFKFIGDYKQADDNAKSTYAWRLPTGKTKDTLTTGDEICSRDQCFNFIKYDGQDNDIVMLAKYNLKVGYIYDNAWNKIGRYTSSDEGYGLQSSEARGEVNRASTYNGIVVFSATSYWDDNGSPSSSYPGSYYPGTNYPIVYDAQYNTEPDFSSTCGPNNCWNTPGYSVAYYVENYKTILTGYGLTIKEARLLKYDEAIEPSIGCDGDTSRCPTDGFITNTSFWLGSARRNYFVWRVRSSGMFSDLDYKYGTIGGVRPVIVVSKANI